MTKKIFIIFLAALMLLVSSGNSSQVLLSAQENQQTLYNLSISPPTAYLRIRPGNLAVHSITVKNNGSAEVAVTPKLVDFGSDGVTGQPILANNSSFPYLDMNRTSLETLALPPGATAQLTLHFSIPSTAENSEYPLTVLFEARSLDQQGSGTSVTGTIGSNLVVLISDTSFLEQQFSVETFNAPSILDSFQPIAFSPILKNNSFAATVASGSAQIANWQGTVVAQYEISPEVVLGYATRQIQPIAISENPDTFALNDYDLRIFSYKSAFLIGPYTISLFIPSGDPNNLVLIEHKFVVWAFPIALIIAVIVASLLITVYYLYIRRKLFFN